MCRQWGNGSALLIWFCVLSVLVMDSTVCIPILEYLKAVRIIYFLPNTPSVCRDHLFYGWKMYSLGFQVFPIRTCLNRSIVLYVFLLEVTLYTLCVYVPTEVKGTWNVFFTLGPFCVYVHIWYMNVIILLSCRSCLRITGKPATYLWSLYFLHGSHRVRNIWDLKTLSTR